MRGKFIDIGVECEFQGNFDRATQAYREASSVEKGRKKPTKVSPFSFLILAGRPAGNACWKTSILPVRAALYIFPANSITGGGISPAFVLALVSSAMISYRE
jgi:hypothetical protein